MNDWRELPRDGFGLHGAGLPAGSHDGALMRPAARLAGVAHMKHAMFFPRGTPPGSLADRGAIVPFQTPALLATRARPDERAGIAAVVPNFAGNGAQFIIPWPELPATFPLNPADSALHKAVAEDHAVTPERIEAAARRVAASGAAGPEALAEWQAAEELENARQMRLQTLLMVHLARMNAGLGASEPDLRDALRRLRRTFPMHEPAELVARIGSLAHELLPIGLPEHGDLRQAGRMRVLVSDIAHMRRHLARRAGDMPELAGLAHRFDRAAADTLRAARRSINVIDVWLLQLPRQVQAWPESLALLRKEVRQLFWLLDGWEQAIACYATCVAEWLTPSRERHLARLAMLAPVIPAQDSGLLELPSAAGLGEQLVEARRAALGLLVE